MAVFSEKRSNIAQSFLGNLCARVFLTSTSRASIDVSAQTNPYEGISFHSAARSCLNMRLPWLWAFFAVGLIFCFSSLPSHASEIDPKTRGMLDFIGTIEGPAGYDDYYRGVSSGPPRALSTMSIREVLAWQDSIDATSRSEAAGRYQIMEDTLRGLVRSEGIDQDRLFDGQTQDELATTLLKRRGWDPTRTDYVNMGDAIAYEWAALPICSGFKAGKSAYDGLAGNHSLTSCEAYLEVLANGDDPSVVAWALTQSSVGGSGTGGRARVNNILDRFISSYKNAFYDLSDKTVTIAGALLLSLMLIEWIWTTARQVVDGVGIGKLFSALAARTVVAGAFLFLINLGNFSDLVIRSSDALLMETSEDASINVIDLFNRLLGTTFELFGRSTFAVDEKFAAVVILFLGTLIIGLIIMSYMEVYLAFGAGLVALGFGSFSKTQHIAVNYMKRAVGRVFRLFTALFCGALLSVLLIAELDPEDGDHMLLASIMVILVFVILRVPSAVEQAVVGSVSISSSETLSAAIRGTPMKLIRGGGSLRGK